MKNLSRDVSTEKVSEKVKRLLCTGNDTENIARIVFPTFTFTEVSDPYITGIPFDPEDNLATPGTLTFP